MLLTRKTDYALVALAGLAHANGRSASARDLADELKLPLPVLRNILKDLATHGLLISTRGPSGGYRLARAPEQITLADVVEIMEGPVHLARCCSVSAEDQVRCELEDSCLIKGNVRMIHESLMQFLHDVNLSQIIPESVKTP